MLAYMAESAGGSVALVDPRGTSQQCSGCGLQPERRKTLADRAHECDSCGLVMDRDVNAARNVLLRFQGREPAFGRKAGGLPRSLAEKPSPPGDGVFTSNT
ncbi:MAG: transposase [Paracoccaceae bacterium]|nr:transposase [Paracoccaceae bacterium]